MDLSISFFYRHVGLISLFIGNWSFHLLPSKRFWKFGHSVEPYDMCMDYYGLGPLFLACKMWMPDKL